MKFDIRKDGALCGAQHVSFTVLSGELSTRIKMFVTHCWQKHLLRCAVMAERKTLAKLSDRELQDMGINRVEAVAESQRRYSDLPNNRSI